MLFANQQTRKIMSFEEAMVDYVLPLSYWLIGAAVILALVMGIAVSVMSNPKGMMRSLIAIVLLAIVFGIGYSIAGDEMKPFYQEFGVETPGDSKLVGGGLMTFYILFAIAAVGIVFTEISKAFK
jgi:hypothetical protein